MYRSVSQVKSVQPVCRCIVGVLVHLPGAIVQILDQILAVQCQRFGSVHSSTMPALCSARCRQSSGSRSGSGLPMVFRSHPQHLGPWQYNASDQGLVWSGLNVLFAPRS